MIDPPTELLHMKDLFTQEGKYLVDYNICNKLGVLVNECIPDTTNTTKTT